MTICSICALPDVAVGLEEQLDEPFVLVTDRDAVDFEHVSELNPPAIVDQLDQQKVGPQLATLGDGKHRSGRLSN